jgi:hypothetical protein
MTSLMATAISCAADQDPENDPRQDQARARAQAVASAAEAICASDSEAEATGGPLSCPDETQAHCITVRFRWLIEAGCCSASLLKFAELCSKHT